MPMQMLMPMPSYRCRDFQMAFLKKQFLLFVLFLTQGKGKHETLFTNVNRSTNKYSVPYYDIYQLPTIENYFILYLGFLSRQFANHRTSAEGGGHWTPYYYFYHFRAFLPYVLMCLPFLRVLREHKKVRKKIFHQKFLHFLCSVQFWRLQYYRKIYVFHN